MRTARLVGPTADGTSVVLVTEDGEEITVALDPDAPIPSVLRPAQDEDGPTAAEIPDPPAPVRRPPPRRETPMDTPLSPRDIQTRIRAGETLEDVVAGSGMDAERIERFAAPVLAEREHLALTALGSSVRRRGEASGHRPLRSVVAERLQVQGVDADDVRWDAWKIGDSQWQLSADYELQGEARRAEFRYDQQGRFSVAEDDEARWLAGEAPSPVAASDDRDDELALVKATREPSGDDAADDRPDSGTDDADEVGADAAETEAMVRAIAEELGGLPQDDDRDGWEGDSEPTLVARRDEAAEPTIAVVRHLSRLTVEVDTVEVDVVEVSTTEVGTEPGADAAAGSDDTDEGDGRSALDTLYDMLGGYAEDSPRVYPGLSDATAVPVVDEHEFEPPRDVLVPAEPVAEPADADAEPEAGLTDELPVADAPEEDVPPEDDVPEPLIPSPGASRKPGRRKRASVPSWDEIMFGGPKPG